MDAEQAAVKIRSHETKLYRCFKGGEVERAIRKAYDGASVSKQRNQPKTPKWPAFDPTARDHALEVSPVKCLDQLAAPSDPIPEVGTVDHVLDRLFPGNPLLCIGREGAWSFETCDRESLRGKLNMCQLIVPSPMISILGEKMDGSGLSEHTDVNTGPRYYLIVEFDSGISLDIQGGLLAHLDAFAQLVCVTFSGKKSLHGWFDVRGVPEWQTRRFFAYAVRIGADPKMWKPSQFTRLPGGWRDDTKSLQRVYFLKQPGPPPNQLPPPPGSVTEYQWQIESAAEIWTNDPAEIELFNEAPLLKGLLRKGDVSVVIGGAKTLKTWFALSMAISAAAGTNFLGHETYRAKVLYLDYELRHGTFRKRMCMLAPQKPDGLDIQLLRGKEPLPTVEQLEDIIVQRGFELVFIDSLYRTGFIREENSNDSTSRDLTALQLLAERTGAAIVVIDHTAKGGGQDRSAVDAARGASAKGGFFDSIIVLRPQKSEEANETRVAMDVVARDWPPATDLPVFALKWGDGMCRIDLVATLPHDATNLTLARLEDILRRSGEPMSVSDLERESGIPATTIRSGLKKLESAGRVEVLPDARSSQRRLYRIRPAVQQAATE